MGEHGIDVYSNNDAMSLLLDGDFAPYIPEYRIDSHPSNSGFRLMIDIGMPFSVTQNQTLRNWLVCGSLEDLRLGYTIPYLIHYILEIQRMQHSQVTIHGAGIVRNGQGILLLGKQGSGKTSVSLELCRHYGCSLVGNDLVLLGLDEDQGFLYGGTKIFRLRRATVTHYNTDLQHLFDKKGSDKDDWTSVTTFKPDVLSIAVSSEPAPLLQVVYIHLLNDLNDELHVSSVEKTFSRLFLFEETSRYIRGVCFPTLMGQSLEYGAYLPSLDNPDFHQKRKRLISWIENRCSYHYVSGPMHKICAYLMGGGTV
jgi:hypothetical protein